MAGMVPDANHAIHQDLYAKTNWQQGAGVNLKQHDGDSDKHWLLSSTVFSSVVCITVLANTILMGIEVDHPEYDALWKITENLFTAVFALEMLLKLYILRFAYFSDRGNWFDGALVLIAALEQWILTPLKAAFDLDSLSALRALRVLRLARVFRLFLHFERFSLILVGISEALQTTVWVGSLIAVFIFTCAIFCTEFLGRQKVEHYPGYTTDTTRIDEVETIALFNPYLSFGSMSSSMLTLFNILIGAEWSGIMWPVYLKQPYFVLFFLGFMLFLGFGVMNVIIALIVDRVMKKTTQREMESVEQEIQRRLQELEEIRRVLRTLSTDVDGRLDVAELEKYMEDPEMTHLLKKVNLPRGMSAHELLVMLDEDGDGMLYHDEIVRGLYRLIDSDSFQRLCLSQMSINTVLARVAQNSRQNAVTQDMVKSLSLSVSKLLAQLQTNATWNQNPPAKLPVGTPGLEQTVSKTNLADVTLPLPSANVSALETANASTCTDACAEPLAAVTAKIEAQIAQILMDEQVLDAICANSVAAVCRLKVSEEVVYHLERDRQVEHVDSSVLWHRRCQSDGLSHASSPLEDRLPMPNTCRLGTHVEQTIPRTPLTAAVYGDSCNEANELLMPHSLSEASPCKRPCWPSPVLRVVV